MNIYAVQYTKLGAIIALNLIRNKFAVNFKIYVWVEIKFSDQNIFCSQILKTELDAMQVLIIVH